MIQFKLVLRITELQKLMLGTAPIHEWLKFAGRWDSKTINAKLASIRQFEVFCKGSFLKRFDGGYAPTLRQVRAATRDLQLTDALRSSSRKAITPISVSHVSV
jgi:hypothetical protein